MPKLNTSVLIGDTIYPAHSTISKDLAKLVDDKSVFGDDDGDGDATEAAVAAAEKEAAEAAAAKEAAEAAAAEKEAADAKAAGHPVGEPSVSWKSDELDAYAASKSFDISAASNKQEKVDAIAAAAKAADAGNN